jgi:haloalkane dehalogenase
MKILRTPDSCFENLAGYPFEPHYVDIPDGEGQGGTLRVHYIDEGPRDASPILFMHGNPTWSYLWRKIVPRVVAAGHRAIAIDLVGMGRSDKPSEMSDYTVARHVHWMRAAIFDALDLRDCTFVLHDWGVIIGLRMLSQDPDRVSAVCVSNSRLPLELPEEAATFAPFQQMVREDLNWEHWNMVAGMVLTDMPQADIDGYHAPCPSPGYLVCNRQFTQLLPTTEDNPMYAGNRDAWKVIEKYERPFLTLYGDKDIVAPSGYRQFCDAVPGAKGQPHTILEGGSHFLQEDVPEEYARVLLDWLSGQVR